MIMWSPSIPICNTPPHVIVELLKVAERGFDVVYGVRPTRSDDNFIKRTSARIYYKLMRSLTGIPLQDSAADFRLISRRVVEELSDIGKSNIVFRLLIPSLGFRSEVVNFVAAERFAGRSKYSLRRMVSLMVSSVISTSTKPLTFSISLGFVMGALSFMGFAYVVLEFFQGRTVPGWASQLSVIFLLFGLIFFVLGIIGAYIGALMAKLDNRSTYKLKNGE